MIYLGCSLMALFIIVILLALLIWISTKQFELIYNMLRLTLMEEVNNIIRKEMNR